MTVRAAMGCSETGPTCSTEQPGTSRRRSGTKSACRGAILTTPGQTSQAEIPCPHLASFQGIGVYSHQTPFYPGDAYVTWPLAGYKPTVYEPVEPEYPEAAGKRLVSDRQLRRKQYHSHVERGADQSGCFSGPWPLHAQVANRPAWLCLPTMRLVPLRRIPRRAASSLFKIRQLGQYYSTVARWTTVGRPNMKVCISPRRSG